MPRDKVLHIRVTDEAHEAITEAARRANRKASDWGFRKLETAAREELGPKWQPTAKAPK